MKWILTFLLALVTVMPVTAGDHAPDFKLKDTQGKMHSLTEYLEHGPVLMSYWATWCEPCKKEIPHMLKLSDAWADSGLTYLLIAVDTPKTQSRIKSLVKSKKWDAPVLLDTSGKTMRRYKGNNPPVTILINSMGEIIMRHTGFKPGDEKAVQTAIQEMFASEAATN